jgi:hypothetical protein
VSWIVGIDYSTHAIDVVYIDEDDLNPPYWERFELAGQDAWERTRTVKFWSLASDDVLAVGLEEPRGQNSGVMYRIQGALLSRLPSTVLVQPWVPSAWRKAVGLAGGCSKTEVGMWAYQSMGRDDYLSAGGWPNDATDAYAIAVATRAALQVTA